MRCCENKRQREVSFYLFCVYKQQQNTNKTKYTMDPGVYFLMKINK